MDVGSHPLSEACRKNSAQRLSAESGRRAEEQSAAGSGSRTFTWITRACLGSGRSNWGQKETPAFESLFAQGG